MAAPLGAPFLERKKGQCESATAPGYFQIRKGSSQSGRESDGRRCRNHPSRLVSPDPCVLAAKSNINDLREATAVLCTRFLHLISRSSGMP
eukprot:840950-Rhodomonas_salina.2